METTSLPPKSLQRLPQRNKTQNLPCPRKVCHGSPTGLLSASSLLSSHLASFSSAHAPGPSGHRAFAHAAPSSRRFRRFRAQLPHHLFRAPSLSLQTRYGPSVNLLSGRGYSVCAHHFVPSLRRGVTPVTTLVILLLICSVRERDGDRDSLTGQLQASTAPARHTCADTM